MLIIDARIFLKNTQWQILLTIKCNQKFQGDLDPFELFDYSLPAIMANDHRVCFQKCASFSPFLSRVKKKERYSSLRLLNIFKNILQIMTGVLGHNKNVRLDRGLLYSLVFFFQWENGLHETMLKHQISLELCRRFYSFFDHVFGKIMEY